MVHTDFLFQSWERYFIFLSLNFLICKWDQYGYLAVRCPQILAKTQVAMSLLGWFQPTMLLPHNTNHLHSRPCLEVSPASALMCRHDPVYCFFTHLFVVLFMLLQFAFPAGPTTTGRSEELARDLPLVEWGCQPGQRYSLFT